MMLKQYTAVSYVWPEPVTAALLTWPWRRGSVDEFIQCRARHKQYKGGSDEVSKASRMFPHQQQFHKEIDG